jgi:hypothetical protein
MFWVLFAPIIRSILKLYMQFLVQSCVDAVSGPVSCGLAGRWERLARVVARSGLSPVLKLYMQFLVQSCVDAVSGPVSCGMAGRWERLARVVAKSGLSPVLKLYMQFWYNRVLMPCRIR